MHDSTEMILLELQAGIIPTQMFFMKMINNENPFDGMTPETSRALKRKWRKLKKKYKVKKANLSHAAFEIRHELRRERDS